MLKLKSTILTALVAASVASSAMAQTPRTATYSGSTWGFYLLESGSGMTTLFTGQPEMHHGQPDATITIISRDTLALTEADRALAIALARGLCEQTGRRFNTQTQGHWVHDSATGFVGLGFQGACSRW
jgi:hypothetical protein